MGIEWRSKRLIVRNSLLTIFILNVTLKETNRVLRIGMTYGHPSNAPSYLSSHLNSSHVDSFVFLLLPTDATSYVCPVLHVPSYLHSFCLDSLRHSLKSWTKYTAMHRSSKPVLNQEET
jgi:hypothetical protein